MVLYSSGTGVPAHCPCRWRTIQHMKEHQLHCDIRPGDRVMYFTTTGYDKLAGLRVGKWQRPCSTTAPMTPSPSRLFDIVDSKRSHCLEFRPYIDSLRKAEMQPIILTRLHHFELSVPLVRP